MKASPCATVSIHEATDLALMPLGAQRARTGLALGAPSISGSSIN